MASYAMAHLKLDLLLTELGYKPTKQQRLKVFLTNSLEEHHPDTDTLFAAWLASEANEANKVKRDTPVMVVMGNPPYSISSSNKGKWINKLIEDYKKNLSERNIQPLSDDYIKFIRYGQHYIEKNGSGILAYISNNSFLDGITHREMRRSLLSTFDKIYILDLHGSSNKRETTPDGSKDKNVFDIMQGVSINIFIKKSESQKLADVHHYDLYGKRDYKYDFLLKHDLDSVEWGKLDYQEPYYFFSPKDFRAKDRYMQGFEIEKLFSIKGSGIKFRKDNLLIKNHFQKNNVLEMIKDMNSLPKIEVLQKYSFKETKDWIFDEQKKHFEHYNTDDIKTIAYRPFDKRFTYYPFEKISYMIPRGDSRQKLMKHLFEMNYALLIPRQAITEKFGYFVTNIPCDINFTGTAGQYGAGLVFPLYLYPDNSSLTQERTPNLNQTIIDQIAKTLNLTFTPEKSDALNTFAPIDILDYIYAVLHSPSYREKYKEFLKINFPRVPCPTPNTFWQLVELGSKLRRVHLLESPEVEEYITSYPIDGDNTITRKIVKKDFEVTDEENGLGLIWINDEQYFDNIPVKAWEFYIGGYQPAQKWLKDRKERTLGFEDILHYQKIVKALMLTDQYMKEIDQVVSWE